MERAQPRVRIWIGAVSFVAVVLGGATCVPFPVHTDEIEAVSSTTLDGWRYDYFRNRSYPCSISGYQTFVIGTKVGSSATETRPLWVKLHGGGVGWFDASGAPVPGPGNKSEESRTHLIGFIDNSLTADVLALPAGFRVLVVSMCNHDLYAGGDNPDPDNPNTEPDGTPVTVNGRNATMAAIQYTRAQYPTDDYFLDGGSAGSAGSFHVAWGMQLHGVAPSGIVADSGIVNELWEFAQTDQAGPCARGDEALERIIARWAPELAAAAPDQRVSSGVFTVPIMHVWNRGDRNVCSDSPMDCPLRDGSVIPEMWAASCIHEPMRLAIEAQGPESRSANLAVCVDDPATPAPCDVHVVTNKPNAVNIDLSSGVPADFVPVIVDWVLERLADD